MMNFIGKGLVLVHTLFSLLGLGLALVIFYEFVDWGRSEPRVSRGEPTKSGTSIDTRIPSEFDKSKVMFDDAVAGRNLVITPMVPAEDAWHQVEDRLAQNHLYYVAELRKVRTGDGQIEVKGFSADGIPTDAPGKRFGKAIPDARIDGLDKPLSAYRRELDDELKKLDPIEKQIAEWAEKNQEITYQLTGKDAQGKKVCHGIFELINIEFQNQQLARMERDGTHPRWATVVEEARRYGARRDSLEATLSGLQQTLKAKETKQKK
jgi:hypothetical protein